MSKEEKFTKVNNILGKSKKTLVDTEEREHEGKSKADGGMKKRPR